MSEEQRRRVPEVLLCGFCEAMYYVGLYHTLVWLLGLLGARP